MLTAAVAGSADPFSGPEPEFVDLLPGDESDLVRMMFEDIVAAEWSPTLIAPVENHGGARGPTARVDEPRSTAHDVGLTGISRHRRAGWAGLEPGARERSPPGPGRQS